MKSRINKSGISLLLAAFLFWSIGCSPSQNALNSDNAPPAAAETGDTAGNSSETWVKTALLVGGAAVVIGGLAFVIPRISAATKFSGKSGDTLDDIRLPWIK